MAGELDVGEILRRPAKWFRGWELYDELEPIGAIRDDYHAAHIVQTLFNIHRGKKDKAIKLEDCILKFGPQEKKERKQTPEQQFAMLKVLAAMHAGEGESKPLLDLSAADRLKEIAGDNPNVTFA